MCIDAICVLTRKAVFAPLLAVAFTPAVVQYLISLSDVLWPRRPRSYWIVSAFRCRFPFTENQNPVSTIKGAILEQGDL
jgi:hypothetical protein